ncbi:MAG: class II glutamine amidotransferase [Bacteroidales bacterium]|jgi:amidophosphoribosyltransferase|nr:class II glutamine amidotransferase [Bacteroidales bacterium]MBO7180684.1 class II glutamine amidotransferase [Bacteroidales bacterium]MBO7229330.1 class II glutamine amidotransferase [Bacteroidales bacterium]MBQ2302924.1 class II glutamine amidotransferase [Bacteroidales bacterium]MBQ2386148.1 class II glutamine amidotransferase [Bacteroidales bacterium]
MSEQIKHECGIAMLRLLKPLEYYQEKYGNAWALNRMYLLMEKQHNRGQDGAGLANIKFDTKPGEQYINITKSNSSKPIQDIFNDAFADMKRLQKESPDKISDVQWLKQNARFVGELFLGHLRYGTFGKNELDNLHPFLRENNWKTRNLVLAGNFNLTNIDEMLDKLISLGQHPVKVADAAIILEKIGKFLDRDVERIFKQYKAQRMPNIEISQRIGEELDIETILTSSAKKWDGGYVMAGLIGHGDAFVLRDENGIRPCFYYYDDEIAVVASERPVIMTTFNKPLTEIKELEPGHAIIIKKNGQISIKQIKEPAQKPAKCSFERIYFSRGTDADIYEERKALGKLICPRVLQAIDYDIKNTVISYIPNTASVAFQGMAEAFADYANEQKIKAILENKDRLDETVLRDIFTLAPRREYIAVKDVKLRTFITKDSERDDMVAHVYDVTYGQVREYVDNLVVIDDSIVRGTTLKQSIVRILDRLGPKKIVIASSAPQIRYPDCYGIDMSRMGEFIAFNAAIALLKESGQEHIIEEVYRKSKAQENLPKEEIVNYVKEIYAPFTDEQISAKITELVTPDNINAEIEIVFNTIESLHKACPENTGDWYFTGDYPTPGGNKVVNRAFINYYEGNNQRAY